MIKSPSGQLLFNFERTAEIIPFPADFMSGDHKIAAEEARYLPQRQQDQRIEFRVQLHQLHLLRAGIPRGEIDHQLKLYRDAQTDAVERQRVVDFLFGRDNPAEGRS